MIIDEDALCSVGGVSLCCCHCGMFRLILTDMSDLREDLKLGNEIHMAVGNRLQGDMMRLVVWLFCATLDWLLSLLCFIHYSR